MSLSLSTTVARTSTVVADETAMELRHHAQGYEEQEHDKHNHYEFRSAVLVFVGLSLMCYLYEDPLFLATRVLRGEFPDNDAFVAFLEFYHT